MFIGHICDGVGVGAVEVDKPEFWDYFCSLGLDGLQVTLAEPTVDGVIGIAYGGYDLRYGECIGDSFKFLFEQGRKVDGREEGNPVLRGWGLRLFPYFAVENSA